MSFIGRKQELQTLNKLFKKNSASLVVIQGRRRIGKSRLIEEFAKKHKFFEFAGIAPTKASTIQSELDEFARQLSIQTGLPEIKADDWSKLFLLLSDKIQHGRIIVLLDEITWMGSKDPDFLGKLKNAWDMHFKKNTQLIFVLCGSISVWIDENILSSTGFLGRISLRLTLEELPLSDCNHFWNKSGGVISAYEKLKVLAVTGGVPRYLEEIKPTLSAEENIRDLCFTKGGALVNEFNEVFSDLFSKNSKTYQSLVQTLSAGACTLKDICVKLNVGQTGFISECLEHLIKSGFVTRDYTWSLKSGEASRLSHFRLSDNYIRFYLKYMEKNLPKIENNAFEFKSWSILPNWESTIALQFENLVLKNRAYIKQCLGLKADDIISDNPFFQRKTARMPGCQVDYLIHTKFNTLYVCEIKFQKNPINSSIFSEMEKKLSCLQMPRGFSHRAVLIHINGVQESVECSDFFVEIIDFSQIFS